MEERPYNEIIDATCPSCRHGVPMDANVCPYCGYRIKPEAAKTVPTAKEKPPSGVKPITAKPVVGGVLIIISGLMGVIVGLSLAVLSGEIMEMIEDMYGPDIVAGLEGILTACGVIWFIIGLIAVIGGIFAIRRKKWGFAVVGGVLALLTIGPWLLGSILGLIGLILVAISRNEFS
ncbi:MAG: zinc ribbon domain-containing protein [Methanomassiliicoccales archaeon]